ncbi:MAG: archaemetzincin family Zn-dependent metalloprotease [Planctomycetota bacterium]|jgi:archaemetzincin
MMVTTLNIITTVCLIIMCGTSSLSLSFGVEAPRAVRMVPVGEVQEELLSQLADSLREDLGVVVQLGPRMEVPAHAYKARRNQYFSTEILRKMNEMKPGGKSYLLGVTEVDLYVPTLNFVLGEALPFKNVAIISLHRLREEFYEKPPDEPLLYKRMLTEAVHELGHLWGMRHCPNPDCVMFFSNTLVDTDRKSSGFCDKCKVIFERRGG